MAAVVRDIDGGPGRPGGGLLQVRAGQGVARLVLLQGNIRFSVAVDKKRNKKAALEVRGRNHKSLEAIIEWDKIVWKCVASFLDTTIGRTMAFEIPHVKQLFL